VAPNVVEILFELGLEHHVVAVGDHCVWPPEVAGKPRIGGLLDPRLETIASLEPDLAILLPSEQQLVTSLERLGVEVLVTPVESLLDVESAIDAIAARTGMQAKGAELVERLRSSLAPREMAEGPEVLLVVGREPGNLADIYVAAGGTFLDELLGRLGGSNIVADSPVRYPQVGLEEIATRGPKVIVELQPEVLDDTRRARLIDDWKRDLPVAEVCVAVVEGDHVLVPGPRVVDLYDDLAKALISCEGER
jgi:iron complex transport system substrate-binding protein